MGPNPLYCKIFVDARLSEKELTAVITRLLGGRLRNFTVEAPVVEVDVRTNDAVMQVPGEAPSFVNFPFYLDVEPSPERSASREDYVCAVSGLLRGLWDLGLDAVAACQFEDELPRRSEGP
jgi:hypothetical protein